MPDPLLIPPRPTHAAAPGHPVDPASATDTTDATSTVDWWDDLYCLPGHAAVPTPEAARPKPLAPIRSADRLPPPGHVLDLDSLIASGLVPPAPGVEQAPAGLEPPAETIGPAGEADEMTAGQPTVLLREPGHSRRRFLLFNGSAAAAGYAVGLEPVLDQILSAAEHAVTPTLGLLLGTGAATAVWRITRLPYVAAVLPVPQASRLLLTIGVALIGTRLAPAPVAYLNAHGAAVGLRPGPVALLITSATLCGGLWWAIDRRVRTWWWGARLAARIPLASAVLAVALHTSAPVVWS